MQRSASRSRLEGPKTPRYRIQRNSIQPLEHGGDYPKPAVVRAAWAAPVAVSDARVASNVVPRAASHDAGVLSAIKERIRPFPYIAAHILGTTYGRAARESTHSAFFPAPEARLLIAATFAK